MNPVTTALPARLVRAGALALLAVLLAGAPGVRADEGMYPLSELARLNLQAAGPLLGGTVGVPGATAEPPPRHAKARALGIR